MKNKFAHIGTHVHEQNSYCSYIVWIRGEAKRENFRKN